MLDGTVAPNIELAFQTMVTTRFTDALSSLYARYVYVLVTVIVCIHALCTSLYRSVHLCLHIQCMFIIVKSKQAMYRPCVWFRTNHIQKGRTHN